MRTFEQFTEKEIWAEAKVCCNCGWWYIQSRPMGYGDNLIYWPAVNKWMGNTLGPDDVIMGYFASEKGAKNCIEKHKIVTMEDIPVNTKFKFHPSEEDCVGLKDFIKTNDKHGSFIVVFEIDSGSLLNVVPTRRVIVLQK